MRRGRTRWMGEERSGSVLLRALATLPAGVLAVGSVMAGFPPAHAVAVTAPTSSSDARASGTGDLLITGVSVVDPSAEKVSPPSDILIAGGRIEAIAPAGQIPPSRADEVLSAEGLYALPGLIDVHAHIGDGGLGRQSEADREGALAQFLRYGVTTVFVPGGGGGNDHQLARWKERCRSGELLCPDLYGSGALITAPGSHPIGTIWNLPADVDPKIVYQRGAVAVAEDEPVGPLLDRKVELGADGVKIVIEDWSGGGDPPMPRLSTAKARELTAAAHERGLEVFAHISLPVHVEDALAAGVDGVMHSAEEPLSDAVLSTMADRGVFYVATLALYNGFFDRTVGRVEPEPFAAAGAAPRALASLENFRESPFDPAYAATTKAALESNLRRAAAAGVPLALGSDVNNPSVFPGYSAHEELELMVEAGLTPAQALSAASAGGAAFLGRESTLGKIAPGFEADLLLLGGNPLKSIYRTRDLRAVLSDGRPVEEFVSEDSSAERPQPFRTPATRTVAAATPASAPPTMPIFDPAAIDRAADPCDDFYQYACGGWHAANPRPPQKGFWSRPFTQFADEVDGYVRSLIEAAADGEGERSPAEQRIGDYFAACTDTDSLERRGLAPLRPELGMIDGMTSIDDLPSVLGALHRRLPWYPQDGEPLLFVHASADPEEGGAAIRLWIGPAGLGLPGIDYYLDDEAESVTLRRRYREHVAEVLELLGTPTTTAATHAEAILELETALAGARLKNAEWRNDPSRTSNPMSPADLESITPRFRWSEFFAAHGLPTDQRLNPQEPDYLRAVDRLIGQTSLDTWQAYLRWHLVSERTRALPAAFRQARFDFYGRTLRGLEAPTDRADHCIDQLKTDLPIVLSRLFVEHAFQPEWRRRAEELFGEVRAVMHDRIEHADWLEPATKAAARAKVDATRLSLGHPDAWLDDRRLVIRRDDHFGNTQRAGEALRRVSFDRIGRPASLDWWDEPATWVGGYYSARLNRIVVTAAMLLLYAEAVDDDAVLYGGLGAMLAHELIHGFDPHGGRYDAQGRLRDWWTEADRQRFEERSRCVAEQFSQFEYAPGIPVDGDFVVSEQVTELASWSIAWEAFERATAGQPQPERQGFSAAQRYHLSIAQHWCAAATEGDWRRLAGGRSSKAWAAPMVHGSVLHVPEFAAAFGCGENDRMVKPAAEVCKVW